MCVRYGADIIGFVVDYPRPVPWNLSVDAAAALISAVSGSAKTCLVTGGSPDKIRRLAAKLKPDYIQLHGGESIEDTAYLSRELQKQGISVIKTLFPDWPNLTQAAVDFSKTGVYALLVDPRTPDNAAIGGVADLSVFKEIQGAVTCPVILAGGIHPGNAAEMIRGAAPRIIDLMTGVERSPGRKDEAKVDALFQALRD